MSTSCGDALFRTGRMLPSHISWMWCRTMPSSCAQCPTLTWIGAVAERRNKWLNFVSSLDTAALQVDPVAADAPRRRVPFRKRVRIRAQDPLPSHTAAADASATLHPGAVPSHDWQRHHTLHRAILWKCTRCSRVARNSQRAYFDARGCRA
eukprot:2218318-Amphidinium_carterae.1